MLARVSSLKPSHLLRRVFRVPRAAFADESVSETQGQWFYGQESYKFDQKLEDEMQAKLPKPLPKVENPSEATSVLLSRLPSSLTESTLSELCKRVVNDKVQLKKVEIENGCMIHTHNKAEAAFVSSELESKLGLKSSFTQAAFSTLVLENLPADADAHEVAKLFGKHPVKSVRLVGGPSVRVAVNGAKEALLARKAVEAVKVGGRQLTAQVVEVDPKARLYALTVSNFPLSVDPQQMQDAVNAAVSSALPDRAVVSEVSAPTNASLLLRFSSSLSPSAQESVLQKLNELVKGSSSGSKPGMQFTGDVKFERFGKPCLLYRRVPDAVLGAGVERLLTEAKVDNYTRILVSEQKNKKAHAEIERGHKNNLDVTSVYFRTAADALQALELTRGAQGYQGKDIYVAYRELAEPSLVLHNLPDEYFNEDALLKLFRNYKPAYVELHGSKSSPDRHAVIVLRDEAFSEAALAGMSNRQLSPNHTLSVSRSVSADLGVRLSLNVAAGSAQSGSTETLDRLQSQIKETLTALGLDKHVIGVQLQSNVSAHVNFVSQVQASAAFKQFGSASKGIEWWGSAKSTPGLRSHTHIFSRLSQSPVETVNVKNLATDMSVKDLLTKLSLGSSPAAGGAGGAELMRVVSVDRAGLVRVPRAKHVVPLIAGLRKLQVDGMHLRPSKFRSSIDPKKVAFEDGNYLAYNTDTRRSLDETFANHLSDDPVVRLSLARQRFAFELGRAETPEDLLGVDAHPSLIRRAAVWFGQEPSPERDEKLFEIFSQKDGIRQYLDDIDSISAAFGPPNPDDIWDWSQFSADYEMEGEYLAQEKLERAQRDSAKMRQRLKWAGLPILTEKDRKRLQQEHEKRNAPGAQLLGINPDEDEDGEEEGAAAAAGKKQLDDAVADMHEDDKEVDDLELDADLEDSDEEVDKDEDDDEDSDDDSEADEVEKDGEDDDEDDDEDPEEIDRLTKEERAKERLELKARAAVAAKIRYDVSDESATSEMHGVHPNVWSHRDADLGKFVVEEDASGKFKKVIKKGDQDTSEVRGVRGKDSDLKSKYIPLKKYLLDRTWFEDDAGQMDWDVTDLEVRKRLLKLKALDQIHDIESEGERMNAAKDAKSAARLADLYAKQGYLVDTDNRFWFGMVVKTSYVQTTQPQGRKGSFNALVVIGNGKGIGGYGHGHSPTAAGAVYGAYRDALRKPQLFNITTGLTHDVQASFNGTKVQIRAAGPNGNMNAPLLVESVLECVGVGAANANVIGRTNQVATVKATFKALEHHIDLPDLCKATGRRYVTLKYLYDNGIGL